MTSQARRYGEVALSTRQNGGGVNEASAMRRARIDALRWRPSCQRVETEVELLTRQAWQSKDAAMPTSISSHTCHHASSRTNPTEVFEVNLCLAWYDNVDAPGQVQQGRHIGSDTTRQTCWAGHHEANVLSRVPLGKYNRPGTTR